MRWTWNKLPSHRSAVEVFHGPSPPFVPVNSPSRLNQPNSSTWLVSKEGKDGLGPWKTSTALRWEGNLFQVHLMYSYCLCILIEDFGEAMGSGAKINPVLVLDAKGGENKGQSDKWISYHLRDFENSRIELFVLAKLSYCFFRQKLASCGEKYWLWEIGGVFEIFDQSLLEWFYMCV